MHSAGLRRRCDEPPDDRSILWDESTFAYFEATHEYLDRFGKPLAFYSDKASVFRINNANALKGPG